MQDLQLTFHYKEAKELELSGEDAMLWEKAKEARAASYSPYSSFSVGAALLLDNGQIILGTNQENMAYPSGLCAERVALFSAGIQYPQAKILTLAVCGDIKTQLEPRAATPCGNCRQVMLEFEHKQSQPFKLIFKHKDDQFLIVESIKDLMPFAFSF